MTASRITLLAEDLSALAAAIPGGLRFPVLEHVLGRGRRQRFDGESPDHIRFRLFGIEAAGALPIAALTHAADRASKPATDSYWLRSDPVTMWADMAQVYMTHFGFADLDPFERDEIEGCIRSVLEEEGINLQGDNPERWCIPLDKAPGFDFMPLHSALGKDLAESLPSHPEAQFWRRLLGEIQVALHHCPVNVRRRREGRREINSVWFWGGGFMPAEKGGVAMDAVYSDHPVSSGLAIINDCRLKPLASAWRQDLSAHEGAVLIDWTLRSTDPVVELNALERFLTTLLPALQDGSRSLTLIDGSGAARLYGRMHGYLFWRRRRPLSSCLPGPRQA